MNDKLPAELAALYEAERAAPGAPPDARARVSDRLHASLAAPAIATAPAAAAATAKAGALLKLILAVALVGGVATGGVALLRSRARTAVPTTPAPAPAAEPAPPAEPAPAPPPVVAPAPPPAPVPAAPRRRSADRLAAEQALLDQALASLQRNDADGALALLATHETRHANGALVEEREVLAVRALARAGRRDEARDRAARFRARFPNSIQLDVIDALLEKMGP